MPVSVATAIITLAWRPTSQWSYSLCSIPGG